MNLLRLLVSSLVFCLPMFTQSALAQVATLVADEMLVDPGGEITATGNVEIWFEGTKLTASKLVYNRDARSIKISGPIVLTDPANNAVLLADASELSADLRNGLLESAHLVLNNQLQIAARRTARIGGRYTQLENAIASTCRVCAANPVPLWQIRAKEIVHDQKQKRLFFRHAWLDVAGVPVFYLPSISIPEPGVRRATGFLPTKLHSTSAYGSTLQIPYFVTLGDHADVTLTGQIGQQTAGMNIRYRRAFANGDIEFRAEASREYLDPALRGYVDFQGNFRLKNRMRLAVKAETASDIDYMSDFSISGADAWNRSLELRKTTGTFNFGFLAQNEHSLRSYEQGYRDTLPENTAQLSYKHRWPTGINLGFDLTAIHRRSSADIVGRDAMGADLSIGYERTDVFPSGIIAETFASFDMGAAAYNNDSTATQLATYVNPHLGATLRWPLISGSAGGTIHTIEPIIQLGASAGYDTGVVNEDSLLTEFDQSNLFEPVQFAGTNARSYGNFAAMGLKWNASTQGGQHYDVLLGHRWTTDTAYLTPSSGLATQKSDLLVSASAQFSDTIRIDHRSIWDMSGQSSKFDTKLAWTKGDHQISLAQSYLSSDLSENRSSDISLIRFQNGYQINPEWRTDFDFWYDVAAQAPKTAKLTAKFENECLRADLSLSHNFGSSVNVTPDISLEVQMIGFGARGKTRHKTCN